MTRTLGADLLVPLARLAEVLREESAVRQQQLIELLTVHHALRMGSKRDARTVIEGIHKHVRQLLEQEP